MYYSLGSTASLSEQGGGLEASAVKGDVTMPWRDLLSASTGEHDNPLTLNRLVVSPGRYGAAQGGWNRLWSALMRSSVSAGVLVCKISSLDDRPGTTFISDFLKDTVAFRKVKFYNFHLGEEGRAFTKAVGLGLKGTNYVTSLTMRRSDNFPPSSSPDHIATWLFLGGLDKNTSLDQLHLSLGVGTEDADSLVTFLRTMMENRRHVDERHAHISSGHTPTVTLKQLTLFCTVYKSPSTSELRFTKLDEVMGLIGDPTAMPLRKLRIVFAAFPDSIQQSLALAVAGAPCLEEVVVDGPPLDDVQNIDPELVNAIKINKTIHKITIGGEALHFAGELGVTGNRRDIRKELFRNTLGWDRLDTDPKPIVDKLVKALLRPGLQILGPNPTEATTGNIQGSGRGNDDDDDSDYENDASGSNSNSNSNNRINIHNNINNNQSNSNNDNDHDGSDLKPSLCHIIKVSMKHVDISTEGQEVAFDLLNEILDLFQASEDDPRASVDTSIGGVDNAAGPGADDASNAAVIDITASVDDVDNVTVNNATEDDAFEDDDPKDATEDTLDSAAKDATEDASFDDDGAKDVTEDTLDSAAKDATEDAAKDDAVDDAEEAFDDAAKDDAAKDEDAEDSLEDTAEEAFDDAANDDAAKDAIDGAVEDTVEEPAEEAAEEAVDDDTVEDDAVLDDTSAGTNAKSRKRPRLD